MYAIFSVKIDAFARSRLPPETGEATTAFRNRPINAQESVHKLGPSTQKRHLPTYRRQKARIRNRRYMYHTIYSMLLRQKKKSERDGKKKKKSLKKIF